MAIHYDQRCAIARALERVGERWTLLIVRDLLRGPKRFQELRDGLSGISANMLSARLKQMEEDGILEKRIYSQHPLRAEYLLTESGHALERVVLALGLWGINHLNVPIERVHRECGHAIEVHVQCPTCARDVSFAETEVVMKKK